MEVAGAVVEAPPFTASYAVAYQECEVSDILGCGPLFCKRFEEGIVDICPLACRAALAKRPK